MKPAPCGICLARDEQTGELVLIAPTLGALTRKREMVTRDYAVAVYACLRCGVVREQPLSADPQGMAHAGPAPAAHLSGNPSPESPADSGG